MKRRVVLFAVCLCSLMAWGQTDYYAHFQELLDKEIQAYKWRLSIHEEETLKRGDMEAYQQILVKKAIETKHQ